MIGKKKQSWFDANQLQYPNLKVQTKFVWSKRKLGGALLCLPYAIATGVLRILRGYFRAFLPVK